MQIRAVVIVRDATRPVGDMVVTGEVPGPWPTVQQAVEEAILDGQRYRVVGDVIYATE